MARHNSRSEHSFHDVRRLAAAALLLVACSSSVSKTVPAPPPGQVAEEPKLVVPVPDPAPPGLRLSRDVVPTSYDVEWTIVPSEPRFLGRLRVEVEVTKPTWVVWLNAKQLAVGGASIGDTKARVIPGGEDHVGITIDRELAVGRTFVSLTFAGTIDRTKSRGIYAEQEGSDDYVYTFFEPIDARRAVPCFDEPGFKVPWQLSFVVKPDHVALANAPVRSERILANGMKRVVLEPSKPLPSYLVAFVVGPFELVDGGTAGRAKTPIRFIIPRGRAGELGYAKEVTPKVVTALEDYFDMAYPYLKLDVAVVPRYWGTMEHPGIVAMGQPLTLIRPDQATRQRKLAYLNILAHELAHYWFGDYVTMAWWDDTWLNESLGQWLDLLITDAVAPQWEVLDQRVGRAAAAMMADETLSTVSVRQPVTTRAQVEAAFDSAIVYNKGSTVARMYEYALGADRWRLFLRRYIAKHAWGNATADDLLSLARAELGADVEAGLRSFLEQPGVPRISATLSCKDGARLALHQQRSLPAGVTESTARTWSLPVCARYGDGKTTKRTCATLSTSDGELVLEGACPTWVYLNADATGYYRSVVTRGEAAKLLGAGRLTNAEKMMLVEDVQGGVLRDELPASEPLALAPLLAKDASDRVVRSTASALDLRSDALDDALHAKYVAFYVKTMKPIARKLGWTRRPADTDERHELRRTAMWVAYHDRSYDQEVQALARKWLADRSALPDDLVPIVLASAARRGDAALFDAILAAAKTPRDRNEQQRLLGALGGFGDPALATRALALTLSPEFDLRDAGAILRGVFDTRETRATGLAFVEAHADELLARMRDDEATWFLSGLAQAPCDQPTLDRLAAIVTPRSKKYGAAEASVTRGLELSKQCIQTMQRQLPALRAFLK
ncbi:MAG: M1 family metallopeptidase [Myxococcales bacterium]|nr:M1 family metallopeptidase [Myxococcales bacterium]